MSTKFNIELIKGYTRTTSANRTSAVQLIAGGDKSKDCKANAVEAYTTCKELIGVDKGTISIYKALSEMPESVWQKFASAGEDTTDGVKQANQLVRLAQAFALCSEFGVGYGAGYNEGYEVGYEVGNKDGYNDGHIDGYDDAYKKACTVADSEDDEDAQDDSEDDSEDEDEDSAADTADTTDTTDTTDTEG